MAYSFRMQYDPQVRFYSAPGDRYKDVYSTSYDSKGNLVFSVTGREDLYDFIQSHRDSVDIHFLLKRFQAGEEDVFSRAQGFYGDFADMPSTYQEVLNAVIAGQASFDALPAEIKRQFDNNYAKWLMSFEDPDFAVKMGFKPAQPESAAAPVSNSPGAPAPAPGRSSGPVSPTPATGASD